MTDTTAPARRKRPPRPPSRPVRWANAVGAARTALDALLAARDALDAELEGLRDIQQEFSDWRDNLPEGLAQSALGEKLDAVCDIDLEPSSGDLDAYETAVDEAEGADLPLGFGRD